MSSTGICSRGDVRRSGKKSISCRGSEALFSDRSIGRNLQSPADRLLYVGNVYLIEKKDRLMPSYDDLRPEADFEKRDYALVFPKMTIAEKRRTIRNLLKGK